MSTFEVKVVQINAIEPIPNADAIELAVIGDYRSVIRKGSLTVDDVAVYIPEAAIVPAWLLEKMNLNGKLAGKDKNRVKGIRLRGCLSQGLIYDGVCLAEPEYGDYRLTTAEGVAYVKEGDNVADLLGITKYEPAIPVHMSGEVFNAGTKNTVNYDIENFKKYPSVMIEGEEVIFTEKIHGSFCGICILPHESGEDYFEKRITVFSKGLGAQGLCFKDNEANVNNVYVRALKQNQIFEKLLGYFGKQADPTFLLGEVYGPGVQDLSYGNKLGFRVFDAGAQVNDRLVYWNFDTMQAICRNMDIETVPFLYKGPFSRETMLQYTNGTETVSGKGQHIREGIVIRPVNERCDTEIGRVILKSVSEDYLLRKGNVTEYQ